MLSPMLNKDSLYFTIKFLILNLAFLKIFLLFSIIEAAILALEAFTYR